MSVKTSSLHPWSSKILVILLLVLAEHVKISNGYAYCKYYRYNTPWPYLKQCPFVCCPLASHTKENTTCCNPPTEKPLPLPLPSPTTITIFGCRWWTFLLGVFCFLLASILLCHINKRLHVLRKWKFFNSSVGPASAFTISSDELSNYTSQKYSPTDDIIILEQHPPCYNDATNKSTQPPYASVNPPTKTDLE